MYGKMNITENHLKVLSVFTKGFFKEYYVREVQKVLKIGLGTAQKILNDLEQRGVLESQTRGKIKVYRIRKNSLSISYLMLAEDYRNIAFLASNDKIREIIEKITPSIKGIGLVFGSYAKGTQEKGSDLDIFIVGEYDRKDFRKISDAYGTEINVKSYPKEVFEGSIQKDFLVKEILDSHILFLNGEQFVRAVIQHG